MMPVGFQDAGTTARVGLCASCVHANRITSSKMSIFYLCRLSETDPRFPKYPALPVLECDGYQRIASTDSC